MCKKQCQGLSVFECLRAALSLIDQLLAFYIIDIVEMIMETRLSFTEDWSILWIY